ncbi:ribosomal protein lysine methyltransferase Set11 [Schizosaccharomyces japonicus yFS275]|uniref:Ribosomal protein lysine methyltransferase Set11 n=1 Tax=Schizosaccharomyces japonicus (strain yFS275 / FY16936) TaxID=402676 RepID=B6K004_SCHJY|nr:ribosomal protein lysine methyltransferase Set11 [Schizosaccharomyces japonicus yFS275]EEB06154.1 ribosomal protein lysine methyltransferase Set11 [Schizosaccharomyces japonicus yFS275]
MEVSISVPSGVFLSPGVRFVKTPSEGVCVYASCDLKANTLVLRVPHRYLVNKRTCRQLVPRDEWTSHQFLAWCLCKKKEVLEEISPGYTEHLPASFSFHPLTWCCDSEEWQLLPDEVKGLVEEKRRLLQKDYAAVSTFEKLEFREFQLAWLCVNTRCLYYELEADATSEENMTLAPVFEYFNHSNEAQTSVSITFHGVEIRLDKPIRQGEQLYLRYGPHSNDFLMSEYGFTMLNNTQNYLQLDHYLPLSVLQRQFLDSLGYLDDYTCMADDLSFRTQVAIRALLIQPDTRLLDEADPNVRRCKLFVNGYYDGEKEQHEVDEFLQARLRPLHQLVQNACMEISSLSNSTIPCAKSNLSQLWSDRACILQKISGFP